jgi:hypothetical protein
LNVAQDKLEIMFTITLNLTTDTCKFLILIFYSHEAYKYLSALAPSGKYWSIGTNVFSETIFNCNGFVDYITLKHSDVDLEFIATKAAGSSIGWPTNPER